MASSDCVPPKAAQTLSCSTLNKKWEKKWKFEWEGTDLRGSNYLSHPPDTEGSLPTPHKICIVHIIPASITFHIFNVVASYSHSYTTRELNLQLCIFCMNSDLIPVESPMLSTECPGGPLVKLQDSIRVLQFKMVNFQRNGQSRNFQILYESRN